MQKYPPQIELMPTGNLGFAGSEPRPWHHAPRARLFFFVFILSAVAGLVFVFLQASVFQSRASILMEALTAVDRSSSAADIQHVAIQRRILLGSELIDRTHNLLIERGYDELGRLELGGLLAVEPIVDTNLVELIATGSDASALPNVVSTWIEVYLAARAADIEQSLGATHTVISTEINELDQKIEEAREALAEFRAENNIVSAERAENEALARLKGINDSLNNALDDEVRAKSELDSVREAIARGDTVVPAQDQQTLSSMEIELQTLKLQLAELDQRYTREYLARQPSLKVLPEQIASLEAEIASRSLDGKQMVLNEAAQAYVAAQKTVDNIRRQYADHKGQVEKFTQLFAVHQSRVGDLESLEELHRESQSRLVQLETSQIQRYPQVTVIAPATRAERVGPDYWLNTIIALGAALLTAIFAVWLSSFLGHEKPALAPITLSGVRVYPGDGIEGLDYQETGNVALEQKAHALTGGEPAEGETSGDEESSGK